MQGEAITPVAPTLKVVERKRPTATTASTNPPKEHVTKKLREVVKQHLDKNSFATAIFFADKLVTISNGLFGTRAANLLIFCA